MTACHRNRWIRVAALLTAVVGIAVGLVAFGPGYVTSGGIDPVLVRTPDFYRRMWTIILSLAIAGILLLVDALRHLDDA